jgi:putative Mg2+ transporter-C (MgtC) family protein
MTPVASGAQQTVLSFSLDLLVAAVLGGMIGLQRQAAHKPAGFRTHLLVALGSCAFMEISRLAGDSRIAANVITGIGFLGAGAIVRDGAIPRGLTTAASIWAAAAVGMALGFGTPLAYELGATTTVLVFLALSFTDKRLRTLVSQRDELDVAVSFDFAALDLDRVYALFCVEGVHVKRTDRLSIDASSGRTGCWHLTLQSKHQAPLLHAIAAASQAPGVRAVEAVPAAQF